MKSIQKTEHGVKQNLLQIILLIITAIFVGATIGIERTLLVPLGLEFGLQQATVITSFIVVFGIAKAFTNLIAGKMADIIGRYKVLIIGWLIGIPVPLMLLYANDWTTVIFANMLLGINQGICWTLTLFMKIDLCGPNKRGFGAGVNETFGYLAVAFAGFISTELANFYGLRPYPFIFGLISVLGGTTITVVFVRDTTQHLSKENRDLEGGDTRSWFFIFKQMSYQNSRLVSCVQAGLVRNLTDGMAWGLLMIFFALNLGNRTAGTFQWVMIASFGVCQVFFGWLSDRTQRKIFISSGMVIISFSLLIISWSASYISGLLGVILLGIGGALMYPVVIAALSDQIPPIWRATGLGIYRFWRDLGYAIGALMSGIIADSIGIIPAILIVAIISASSGIVVLIFLPSKLGILKN